MAEEALDNTQAAVDAQEAAHQARQFHGSTQPTPGTGTRGIGRAPERAITEEMRRERAQGGPPKPDAPAKETETISITQAEIMTLARAAGVGLTADLTAEEIGKLAEGAGLHLVGRENTGVFAQLDAQVTALKTENAGLKERARLAEASSAAAQKELEETTTALETAKATIEAMQQPPASEAPAPAPPAPDAPASESEGSN